MRKHNWNTIALYALAVVAQFTALHSWHEATTPQFVGGAAIGLIAVIKGMVQPGPSEKP